MKTLIFGAGPLGSTLAFKLHEAGRDVTLLARNQRYDFLRENGVVLKNGYTGARSAAQVPVVRKIEESDIYDLIVVLVRKNKITPVLEILRENRNTKNFLFLGNNALGFDEYSKYLPADKICFGFYNAGGGLDDQVVEYVDGEKPNDGPIGVTLGELDGTTKERTREIRSLFESSGIPVSVSTDIDGWLKYHAGFVLPIAGAFYSCGSMQSLSENRATVLMAIRGVKESGNALAALGYTKRQPFKANLFYWLPEWLMVKVFQGVFASDFARVALEKHAAAAADEMKSLAGEFETLLAKTSVKTPNLDALLGSIPG